jgi:hypothetical protein
MQDSPILGPVVALVAWSIIMMFWMVAARLPAMAAKGIRLKGLVGSRPGGLDGVIDEKAQWKAHNYIHLMEQPTLFYAICLTLALMGIGDGLNLIMAWAYVLLRILHSIVQATTNVILYRFILFTLSSLALLGLTLHAAMHLFH